MQKFAASREVSRALSGARREMTNLHRSQENKMSKIQVRRKQTDGTSLATDGPDPFEAYANAVAPRTIIGTLLRFSKGDYVAGEEGKEILKGSTFLANVDELLAGWIKWSGGKPVEHRMVRVAEGLTLPKREALGDSDTSDWETDEGVPRDPWQFTNYLPLLDEQGKIFTFATSSRGGLTAVGDLTRRYARHRRAGHRDVHPMIALDVGSYLHQNREYGRIKYPLFTPMGWAPKTAFNDALAAAGFTPGAEPPAPQEEAQAEQMNDEVPF
jgi:hypothetical protein